MEPDLSSTEARNNRLDRMERQLAEISARLGAVERLISPHPVAASAIPPAQSIAPPPPKLAPVPNEPSAPATPAPRASLENRLGSQVFNRVGIVALLIGATWFLKLAVDNHWIGATGRVLIGLLAGAGLVLWSERFRRSGYPAFSYSLKALGSGILYLTLWAAFQLFHLLPAAAALAAMLLVTAWNAYMAWSQDSELLAAYALSGGLATPLLLSTGGNHEIFLFTYLLALDVAGIALSRLKAWPRLLPGALLTTAAYFVGWYTSFYAPSELAVTALFVLLFAAAFSTPPFGSRPNATTRGPRARLRAIMEDIVLPLGAAAFASLALYSVLEDAGHHDLLAWLMLALAAAYLALMRLPQSQLASAIHLSIAVVFLTIAIPLKASGAWIVVAWLVEGTALLWVSTRAFPSAAESSSPGRLTLLLLSTGALAIGFIGIFFDLFFTGIFASASPQAFANRGFGTALTGLLAFAASIWIIRRTEPSAFGSHTSFTRTLAASLSVAFNLVAVVATVAQIDLLFRGDLSNTDLSLQRALAVSAFLMLYGAVLLAIGFWQRSAFIRWQALILLVFTIAKTFLYDMRNLSQGYRVLSFLGLGALLMAVSFAYQKDWLGLREPAPHAPSGGDFPA